VDSIAKNKPLRGDFYFKVYPSFSLSFCFLQKKEKKQKKKELLKKELKIEFYIILYFFFFILLSFS
jgi:hypothetical protein